jgi:hypothetical protein
MVDGNPYAIQLLREAVSEEQMACQDAMTRNGFTLVGRPSRAAIQFLAEHFGYACETYNWPQHLTRQRDQFEALRDYAEGWRGTFYLSR